MTGRRGEGAGAWFWVILLLVGLPLGLIHFVGWPLPHHEPTKAEWAQFVADPLTRRTGVDLFAIALWLAWAVLLYAALADLAARLRRAAHRVWRLRKRLPPLPSAGGLLGAAVVGTGTAVVSVVATAHPPVLAAAAPPAPDTPAPPVSPGQAAPDHDQPATTGDWVAVPGGGWVSRQTAAAVAASAAMVWRDRRRHYRPRPLAGVTRDDPDLAPLPAVVTAVSQQVQLPPEQPPDPSDPAADMPDLDAAAASAGVVAVVGERVGQPLPLSALPAGGLGLVGPGAVDAARGVLIAALLSPAGTPAHPTVVTTSADIAVLLEGPAVLDGVPGLLVAPDLMEAIAAIEDVAVARADRATTQTDAQDGSRTVLLAASPTDPQTARQVRVLLSTTTWLRRSGTAK